MRVFIYATEGIYQGLHGIEALEVMEVDNLEEAERIGNDMASSLVEDYGLEDDYYDEEGEYYIEPEFDYLIYPIADEYTSMSIEELNDIANREGHETFIEEYCGEELI